MTPSNRQRADRCQQAIADYSHDDDHSNLVDFLADAMYWADATGDDFHLALAQACRHYIYELNDEQHDERRLNPLPASTVYEHRDTPERRRRQTVPRPPGR